jgi:peptide/nickel transport system permease protein
MIRFLVTRAVTALFTLLGVATIIFTVLHFVPGGFAKSYLGELAVENPELIEVVNKRYGLDRPLIIQYGVWLGNALKGDLGTSLRSRIPVLTEIYNRGRVSVELALLATLFSVVVGIPSGIIGAMWRGRGVGVIMQVGAILGLSIPSFVIGTFLIYFVSIVHLGLPIAGYIPPSENLLGHFGSMVLPVFTLGAITTAVVMRFTRSSMLEVLSEPFVTTAHSKGLGGHVVLRRHVLRNALIPTVTVVGINMGYLLGGTLIVEQIFSLPGLGRFALQGVMGRDYPVAQGAVLFGAAMFVLVNFITDVVYAYLDPRIRY